jgi:hypothetical protein
MNALQTAVAMVFAGLLSVLVAWAVNTQAQQVFESEVRAAAQALLDSVVNQVRVGASTALLPGVYGFSQQASLPSYAPPFDSFYYKVTLRNMRGVLYVQVDMTAYRGSASAFVSLSRAVYNITDLRKPEGAAKPGDVVRMVEVRIYAQAGEEGNCIENGWVDLTQSGCYVVWAMPSPQSTRYLRFVVS